MEPIGDPEDDVDFAEEHESTETAPEENEEGEPESPAPWSGGLDDDGPP